MLRAMLVFVLATLGGCAPAWFSNGNNPPACPVNALAQGACTTEGTACWYVENTGNSARPARIMACGCAARMWSCSEGLTSDAGQDAATE